MAMGYSPDVGTTVSPKNLNSCIFCIGWFLPGFFIWKLCVCLCACVRMHPSIP